MFVYIIVCTQLPLLKSDLYTVMKRCIEGKLQQEDVVWHRDRAACAVVCAAPGYPAADYATGMRITGLDWVQALDAELKSNMEEKGGGTNGGLKVYHAGTTVAAADAAGAGLGCVASGGRVLAVTGIGATLKEAVDNAYLGTKEIHCQGGLHYRTDIAAR